MKLPVSKRLIFISCGQFTEAEKRLGKQIAEMIRSLTDLEPFLAEDVQDLNGLDDNILKALHDCVGFITVLHPRGNITRPDKSLQTRASVWIEQEIAVATYIQRVDKRTLPIIAFKHESVSLEGIRALLHLNPIEFTDESEVLAALPKCLEHEKWKSLKPSGIVTLELASKANRKQDSHVIRTLEVTLVNATNRRIAEYNCEVWVPEGILKHWNTVYAQEDRSKKEPGRRCFQFDEKDFGSLNPRERKPSFTIEYCTQCAFSSSEGIAALVASSSVDAIIWSEDREYSISSTLQELAAEAARRGEY